MVFSGGLVSLRLSRKTRRLLNPEPAATGENPPDRVGDFVRCGHFVIGTERHDGITARLIGSDTEAQYIDLDGQGV